MRHSPHIKLPSAAAAARQILAFANQQIPGDILNQFLIQEHGATVSAGKDSLEVDCYGITATAFVADNAAEDWANAAIDAAGAIGQADPLQLFVMLFCDLPDEQLQTLIEWQTSTGAGDWKDPGDPGEFLHELTFLGIRAHGLDRKEATMNWKRAASNAIRRQ